MVTMKNMDKGSEGHAVAVTSDPLYSGHCKALTLVISPCPQKSPVYIRSLPLVQFLFMATMYIYEGSHPVRMKASLGSIR